MPKFSANISTLFKEAPLIERFALAAKAGFESIEMQFPYTLEKEVIKQQLIEHNLSLNLINLAPGNIEQGELGIACLPNRVEDFKESVSLALAYASFLDVPKINCLAGKKPQNIDDKLAELTFLQNIDYAAGELEKVNKTLLIEAINTQDINNFFLNSSSQAADYIKATQRPNLKLQYDLYHMQIMEGNLINTITRLIDIIGHIQIADVPHRGEPGSGEINFLNIFNALAILGYTDYIGLEYSPIKSTFAGLETLAPLLNLKGG